MNTDQWLWSVLLLLVTLSLLALPFYPAWSEWRAPRDLQAGSVDAAQAAQQGQPLTSRVQIAPGASFDILQSAQLLLGAGPLPAVTSLPRLSRWQPPAGARPWGVQGWHIGQALDIAADQLVPCSLVVRGRLCVHGPCLIEGDVKARESLRLGAGTQVQGNLFSAGDIWLASGCRVRGLVMAEGRLHLEPGVVIGTAARPVSVCADVIDAHGPVLIHGSVQARLRGTVFCSTERPQSLSKETA